MLTIQAGKASDITNRNFRSDVAEFARFETPGGLRLTVGMVADAVRGGEHAPQAAIAGAMQALSQSSETDIPKLIYQAFEMAHRVVRLLAQQLDAQLATTLTMALLVNNERLYVANLGHSRVYLLRAQTGQLLPLTVDHYFANIAIQEGRMSPQEAYNHPDAAILRKYIGTPTLVDPDTGIYGGAPNIRAALQQGLDGLELQPDDSILIVSDGLTKPSRQGYPVITVEQINRALARGGAQQAALDIVEAARRQHPSDTISLVVLQCVPEIVASGRFGRAALAGISATGMLLVLAFFFVFFGLTGQATPDNVAQLSSVELTAFAAQTISAFTETPTATATATSTPTLTPQANRVALNFLNERDAPPDSLPVFHDVQVATGIEYRKMTVNHGSGRIVIDGLVFAQPFTDLRFVGVDDELMQIRVQREGDLFVATNDYRFVTIELAQITNLTLHGEFACMATYYASESDVIASCYAGNCDYQLPDSDDQSTESQPVPIPVGQQVVINLDTVSVDDPPNAIPLSEANRYREIWERTLPINQDSCVASVLPTPTPTFTATPIVIVLPTFTPTPGNTPLPTNTPRPTRRPYP